MGAKGGLGGRGGREGGGGRGGRARALDGRVTAEAELEREGGIPTAGVLVS